MTPAQEALWRATIAIQIAISEAINGDLPGRLLSRTMRAHQNVIAERIADLIKESRTTS